VTSAPADAQMKRMCCISEPTAQEQTSGLAVPESVFCMHTGHFLSLLGISESSSDLSSASSLREPEGLDGPYMEVSGWHSSGRLTSYAVKARSWLDWRKRLGKDKNRTSRQCWASVGT
jgi:hypothetical protein